MINLNVLSARQINGGTFNNIRVLAPLEVNGDIRSEIIDIYDTAVFNAPITAKTIMIEGMASFNDQVDANTILIRGSAYFNQDVYVKTINVKNEVKIKNNSLIAKTVLLQGIATIKEIDAYSIEIHDVINAELIKANKVEFQGHASGTIKLIKGPFITIKPNLNKQLTIDRIIGCNIELSNVTVKYVKGKNIIQGSNCNIEQIEYV
ncbi:hypothetical protein [Haloplasma contractile]|uniref:Polymer-forming cytoskeletal protein n=1 Tax=Haloplasma contractile SSD-17B TaxID=1033810 RepID=F7Q1H3_9MOLU|nr:hypothetical protein [Haloplasma contractile]ERJ12898.1 Polymer-forming cytoskeletal protein [Haloplasma contractile SSD-17B]